MTANQHALNKARETLESADQSTESDLISSLELLIVAVNSGISVSQIDKPLVKLLLKTRSDRVVDLCCDVLRRISFDVDQDTLVKALHGTSAIQTLALQNLATNSESESHLNSNDTIRVILGLVALPNHEVAALARQVIIKAFTKSNNPIAFSQFIMPIVHDLLDQQKDLITIRVYELIAEASVHSQSIFDACLTSGLLSFCTNFSLDDVLLSLNMIEIFIQVLLISELIRFHRNLSVGHSWKKPRSWKYFLLSTLLM